MSPQIKKELQKFGKWMKRYVLVSLAVRILFPFEMILTTFNNETGRFMVLATILLTFYIFLAIGEFVLNVLLLIYLNEVKKFAKNATLKRAFTMFLVEFLGSMVVFIVTASLTSLGNSLLARIIILSLDTAMNVLLLLCWRTFIDFLFEVADGGIQDPDYQKIIKQLSFYKYSLYAVIGMDAISKLLGEIEFSFTIIVLLGVFIATVANNIVLYRIGREILTFSENRI